MDKTFKDFLDEVAKEYGYSNFESIRFCHSLSFDKERYYAAIATERYANHRAGIAFDKGCKAQKKMHVSELSKSFLKALDSNVLGFHNSDIFPNPVNPYKKS